MPTHPFPEMDHQQLTPLLLQLFHDSRATNYVTAGIDKVPQLRLLFNYWEGGRFDLEESEELGWRVIPLGTIGLALDVEST
ncbi:hypothetical protein WG66_002211 [Moniliophthora roreri]|nr:hypothetical protein WG66_002211 [Moniliophthora roreri]